MPRIDDRILNSVFYLYPSIESAKAGEQEGGTGFLIGVTSKVHPNHGYLYAVTNNHVIQEGYSTVIRITNIFGQTEIIPLGLNQWIPHPKGDDIAIAPLGQREKRTDRLYNIPSFLLLNHDTINIFDIGLGDDIYMVGRFVHHDGKSTNKPSVRSGIISVMPDPHEGIEFEEGVRHEAFLIEMHSISGYSGSPVIWQLPLFDALLSLQRKKHPSSAKAIVGPWLIGIHYGSFKDYNKVYEVTERHGEKYYSKTEYETQSHAGQAIVIPAWKIQEFLEEFAMVREEDDKRLTEQQEGNIVEKDVAMPKRSETELGIISSEEFQDALKQVSQKVSSSDEEKKET